MIKKNQFGISGQNSKLPSWTAIALVAIFFAAGLAYSLHEEFYFYQFIVVAILLAPGLVFLLYWPRRGLLALFVFSVAFNPAVHVLRDDSHAFAMGVMFYASDLVMICILIYLFVSAALQKGLLAKRSAPWHMFILLTGLFIAGIISLLPAINKTIVIWGLLRMVRVLVVFAVFFLATRRRADLRLIAFCLLITFAVQSILILAEYGAGHPLLRLPGETREVDVASEFFRPGGTMGHSSNFGKLAALCLPLCLSIGIAVRRKVIQGLLGMVIVIGLVALMLTLSRAGIASAVFGMGLVVILTKNLWRRSKGTIVPIICLATLGAALAWGIGGSRLLNRMKWDYGSAQLRPEMFSVAWNVIRSHPFLGVGLNNYTIVAPEYDRTPEAISLDLPYPVHNVYLLFTAELGVVGGLCFLWFVTIVSLTGFKVAELRRSEGDIAIGYGLGIGIMCCWLQGLVGWGHWASIVHLSYLAMIAGSLSAYKCMATKETEGIKE